MLKKVSILAVVLCTTACTLSEDKAYEVLDNHGITEASLGGWGGSCGKHSWSSGTFDGRVENRQVHGVICAHFNSYSVTIK